MLKPAYFEQLFDEGIDQSAEELVATGGLDILINGEYVKDGGVTKRHGFVPPTSYLTGSGAANGAHTLVANGGAAHVLRKLDAIPLTTGVTVGVNDVPPKPFVAPGSVLPAAQLRDSSGFRGVDAAIGYLGTVRVAAMCAAHGSLGGLITEIANTFVVEVTEVDTGVVLSRVELTGRRPQVVFAGSVLHVYYEQQSGATAYYDLKLARWNGVGTGVWTTATTLVAATGPAGLAGFATVQDSASTDVFVAYIDLDADTLTAMRVAAAGTVTTTSATLAVSTASVLAMCQGKQRAELLFMLYTDGGANDTVKVVSILATLAGGFGAPATALSASSGGKYYQQVSVADLGTTGLTLVAAGCALDVASAVVMPDVVVKDVTYSAGPGLPTYSSTYSKTLANFLLLAQVLVVYPDDTTGSTQGTPTLLLSRYSDTPTNRFATTSFPNSCLVALPLGTNFNTTNFGTSYKWLAATTLVDGAYQELGHATLNYATHGLPHATRDTGNNESSYFVPQLAEEEAASIRTGGMTASFITFGAKLQRLRFDTEHANTVPLPRAVLGPLTYLGGNQLRFYDGASIGESTPLYPPPCPTMVVTAGGSLTASSTYLYSFVFAWEDAKGLIHRSAPTAPVSATTTGANKSVTLDWTNNDLIPTALQQSVTTRRWLVEVYRTEAGGSVYYFEQAGYWQDGAMSGQTLTSTVADIVLTVGKKLYTTGNVLAAEHPPPMSALTTVGNRLWGISAADPRNLLFTKESEEGIAAEWNAVLGTRFDAAEDVPVALAGMGGLVVVFTKREAWGLSTHGGPDALGAGTFGIPERLATGCGASSAEAAVSVPLGVLVHGAAGFRLLTGNGAVDVPVAQDLADGVTVRRALHLPDREEVWFLMRGDATRNRLVVFSYANGKLRWSTWEVQQSTTVDLRDLVSINGVPTLLANTASNQYKVLQLSATSYLDDGDQWIPVTVRTRWFKPEGALAADRFWRVHVFGTGGAAKLRAKVYVLDAAGLAADDTSSTAFLSGTYDWTLAKLALDSRLVHVRRRLDRQRGAAVRVQLQLLTPESGSYNVKGPVLHSVGWDYGTRGKSAKRGATFEPA